MRRSLQFYGSVASMLLDLLDPDGKLRTGEAFTNKSNVNTTTDLFSALPEWYVEDIAEFLLFALQ